MKTNILLVICLFFIQLKSYSNDFSYADRFRIYNSINFNQNPVDQQVFNYAFKGYLTLRDRNKLPNENILSIIDYSKHSKERRLWVMDLFSEQLLFNEWVSHGKYTGSAFASRFSNRVNSKQSSLGFFVTGNTYNGKHKFSLKLYGMEPSYNSNAFRRGIVMHGAEYVSQTYIQNNHRLGRSYGCPAVRQEIKKPLINTIKNGSCLFSYFPNTHYLNSSRLLN